MAKHLFQFGMATTYTSSSPSLSPKLLKRRRQKTRRPPRTCSAPDEFQSTLVKHRPLYTQQHGRGAMNMVCGPFLITRATPRRHPRQSLTSHVPETITKKSSKHRAFCVSLFDKLCACGQVCESWTNAHPNERKGIAQTKRQQGN